MLQVNPETMLMIARQRQDYLQRGPGRGPAGEPARARAPLARRVLGSDPILRRLGRRRLLA